MYQTHPGIDLRFTYSEAASDYYYIYTSQPDESGTTGFSLVQLNYENGEEVARAWVNERKPDFVLDVFRPAVYVRRDPKTIEAVPFIPSRVK